MANSDSAEVRLAIDSSICVHETDLPIEQVVLQSGVTVDGKVLNRTADGALRSAIVEFGNDADLTLPAGGSTVQIYVLEGAVVIDGNALGQNGYAALPCAERHTIRANCGAKAILIQDAPHDGPAPAAKYVSDCFGIEPFVPTIEGKRLEGFERRVLWLDERTGADTRLLKVPAGFTGGGPNWHPVNEEIFCIDGDIQPDETRPMRAGSYLLNPACSIHGFDERTAGGCILLEWHDGPWALTSAPGVTRAV